MKHHQFILTVSTTANRKQAERAVLLAFAVRKPDGCEFKLKGTAAHRKVWMAGARTGTDTALELVERFVENLRGKRRKTF